MCILELKILMLTKHYYVQGTRTPTLIGTRSLKSASQTELKCK